MKKKNLKKLLEEGYKKLENSFGLEKNYYVLFEKGDSKIIYNPRRDKIVLKYQSQEIWNSSFNIHS
jgi:hypothetical protein